MLIKLPNARFINLDRVNMIDFEVTSGTACITWATGDAPLYLQGAQAIAFIAAVEHCDVVDAIAFHELENANIVQVGGLDEQW